MPGHRTAHALPVELPFSGVTALAGAGVHAVYDAHGRIYSCGNNTVGELGDGTTRSSTVPVRVIGLGTARVTALVAAYANSGALLANGRYYDWGYDGQGQLRNGTIGEHSSVPVLVPLPGRVRLVAEGGSAPGNGQTLTKLAGGALYAWGENKLGQVGNGTTSTAISPVLVASGATLISSAAADVMITSSACLGHSR
jgi:alpha-tubulin suppressor-like RCC1 family protein